MENSQIELIIKQALEEYKEQQDQTDRSPTDLSELRFVCIFFCRSVHVALKLRLKNRNFKHILSQVQGKTHSICSFASLTGVLGTMNDADNVKVRVFFLC